MSALSSHFIFTPAAATNATTKLPDLVVDVEQMTCDNLRLQDLVIEWGADGEVLEAHVDVSWQLDCLTEYDYHYLTFGGTNLLASSTDNTIGTVVRLEWQADEAWPTELEVESCDPQVNLTRLEASLPEGTVGVLQFSNLSPRVNASIQEEMNAMFCTGLSSLQAPFQSVLDSVQESWDPYLTEEDKKNMSNPEEAEKAMVAKYDNPESLLNFRGTATLWERLVDVVLPRIHTNVAVMNALLRATMLNAEGSYAVYFKNGTAQDDTYTITTDTSFGRMDLRIQSPRMFGLDSLVKMEPIQVLGNHTLATTLTWYHWTLSLRLEIDVYSNEQRDKKKGSSSRIDATAAPAQPSYTEVMDLELGVRNISFSTTTLLAIDQTLLNIVEIGALIAGGNQQMLACVQALLHELHITKLQVNSLQFDAPRVRGNTAGMGGVHRLFTDALDAIWKRLVPVFLKKGLPNFIWDFAQEQLDDLFAGSESDSSNCLNQKDVSQLKLVDFRDLFLPKAKAREYGSLGREPYGEMSPIVKDFIRQEVLEESNDFADVSSDATDLLNDVLNSTGVILDGVAVNETVTNDLAETGDGGVMVTADNATLDGAGNEAETDSTNTAANDASDEEASTATDNETVQTNATVSVASDADGKDQRQRALLPDLIFPGHLQQTDEGSGLALQDAIVDAESIIFDAAFSVKVDNLRMTNLDSIGEPFSILDPIPRQPQLLNNSAMVGINDRPLGLAATVFFEITGSDKTIRNKVDVSLTLSDLSMVLTVFIKMLEQGLLNYPLGDLFNLNCWLATIPAPTLTRFGVRDPVSSPERSVGLWGLALMAANLTLGWDCLNCTSPKLLQIPDLLASPQGSVDAAAWLQDVIDYAVKSSLNEPSIVQTQLDRLLVEAPKSCPHHPSYDPNANTTVYEPFPVAEPDAKSVISLLMAVLLATASFLVLVFILYFVVQCVVARRHRRWLISLPNHRILTIYESQQVQEELERLMNEQSQSMFSSRYRLPALVRYFVPIVALANIALFLSGHFSQGAVVQVYINIGGEHLHIDDAYSFSIYSAGLALWDANSKELAIILLLFSGIWPYTKQIMTLVLWFLPTSRCSISRRGSLFLWLDRLAKWSMVDVFVMIVTLVAFQVSIRSPHKSFLPDELYGLNLMVQPTWGLYANTIAQLLSQVTSHLIIHYHRVVAKRCEDELQGKGRHNASFTEGLTEDKENSHAPAELEQQAKVEAVFSNIEYVENSSKELKYEPSARTLRDPPREAGAGEDQSVASRDADGGSVVSGVSRGTMKTDLGDAGSVCGRSVTSQFTSYTASMQPQQQQAGQPSIHPYDSRSQDEDDESVDESETSNGSPTGAGRSVGGRSSSFGSFADEVSFEDDPLAAPGGFDGAGGGAATEHSRDSQYPLCQHTFTRSHRGAFDTLQIRRGVHVGLVIAALLATALTIWGCVVPSCSFEYLGLVGILKEVGDGVDEARIEHSVFSIATALVDQARYRNSAKDLVGMGSIASLLILTTLIVPIALLGVTLAEWFMPMRRVTRQRVRVTAEILHAWQYVEVFILSLMVGVWQLGFVSSFFVNQYCATFEPTFAMLHYYGVVEPEDAQCFSVRAELESGTYVLIAAAVLVFVLTVFVAKAAAQRSRDESAVSNQQKIEYLQQGIVMVEPEQALRAIKPVPVLFTDLFRWLLVTAW